MFVLRPAVEDDIDSIVDLAEHLDTLNLPPEREFVEALVRRSMHSFSGGNKPERFDPQRRFLFVLVGEGDDAGEGIVGTSMIHAQHGTPQEPHVFFEIDHEERYAEIRMADDKAREVWMDHRTLRLGMTYAGPTEIGGLVLHPKMRRRPGRLGRLLSLGRFMYIARHRAWFRDRVLAELLPPLYRGAQGATRSPLWDALGSRFTGLTYDEADRLSRDDKGFIWKLFPQMPVHVSLLPPGVQSIIGQVGDGAQGAKRMLESANFHDSHRIDPFDGGPHYEATTDEISVVRDARQYAVVAGQVSDDTPMALMATEASLDSPFRCIWSAVEPESYDERGDLTRVRVPAPDLEALANGGPRRVMVALRADRRHVGLRLRVSGG